MAGGLCREKFSLPEGITYLDGNSLGPVPAHVPARIAELIEAEWGESLIGGWTQHGWMDMPRRAGDRIARLIGAPDGSVIAGDSTSVNLAKALDAALKLRPDRQKVLTSAGNFPTDLYVADGLCAQHGKQLVRTEAAPDQDTAAILQTEVDYRTGAWLDMCALSEAASAAGALSVWDLSHSAGALPIDVIEAGADFAVGCGYKYLNGGPGAPGFIYVRPELQDMIRPLIQGWLGHRDPFSFSGDYAPAPGIQRMQAGTPPILSLAALDAALELWDGLDIAEVRQHSIALSEDFIAGVEALGHKDLSLASPLDPARRGSQVSFHCPVGYPVMQALIAEGVIGDFREPDIMRFGFAPLYNNAEDVARAVETLDRVLTGRLWDQPAYHTRKAVT